MRVHPTAVVGAGTVIHETAVIGAYCVVEPEYIGSIQIGAAAIVGHHSVLSGHVEIGEKTVADPYTRLGPDAIVGSDCKLLYGARVHEHSRVGDGSVIAGNVPDNTTIGRRVVHLGKIAHSLYYPFADWDEPSEPGPTIEDEVVVCTDALLIGPVTIGRNSLILPREIVRHDLPPNTVFRSGHASDVPNWRHYLRSLGAAGWAPGSHRVRPGGLGDGENAA